MSKKIKKIEVKITYSVGLGGVDVDKKTLMELKEAFENGININPTEVSGLQYSKASDWLTEKIKERDCFDWECEILELD